MLSLREDMTSVPHNHRDRVMRLFGKICFWSEKLNGRFFAAWYSDSFWMHKISSLLFFFRANYSHRKSIRCEKTFRICLYLCVHARSSGTLSQVHIYWRRWKEGKYEKRKMFFINRQHWQVEQRLKAFSAQINNLLCFGVLFDGNHATVFVCVSMQ